MKECSGQKVLKVKVAQNDPLDSPSQKNWPGGQQGQGHEVVLHDQGEGYQQPITFWSGSSQVPVSMRCPKFLIQIIVFDKFELIVHVNQGLTLLTASLISDLETSRIWRTHSGTFCMHSETFWNNPEHSRTFWNSPEHSGTVHIAYTVIGSQTDGRTDGQTDIRTCWAASSQLKNSEM